MSFLPKTATSKKFKRNFFLEAIFRWFILKERNLIKPKLPPYYSEDMLGIISSVKEEGFNLNTMSLKTWYKYLLEVQVTHTKSEDTSVLIPCRGERLAHVIDWGMISTTHKNGSTEGICHVIITYFSVNKYLKQNMVKIVC